MEQEFMTGMEKYLEVFRSVRDEVGDDAIALSIVEQLGKDARTSLIQAERANGNSGDTARVSSWTDNGYDFDSDGDQATPKQLGFLKSLGVKDVPSGTSKSDASAMIDAAQLKKAA